MAVTMKTEGVEEISRMLNQLGEKAQAVASKALYDGAGIMAKEIANRVHGIDTAPFKYASGGETRMPSPEEKAVVESAGAVGIAKFDKNGSEVQTSVGYSRSGYAMMVGKRVPIPLIANSINSGTSFMQKQPFIRKAVAGGGPKASEAMRGKIEEEIGKITKGG